MKPATTLVLLAATTSSAMLLLEVGCGRTEGDHPAATPQDGGPSAPETSVEGAFPGSGWDYKTYACPTPGGTFPAGEDRWSPLVRLQEAGSGFHIPPIHLMLLSSGRLLLTGSNMRATSGPGIIVATANFVFSPREPDEETVLHLRQVSSPHASPEESLFCAGHAPLEDGRMVFAGGNVEGSLCRDGGPCDEVLFGLDDGMTFDPATETFAPIAQKMLGGRRWYPTLMRLENGSILVTAGDEAAEKIKNHSVELYDPRTNGWTMLSDEASTPKEVEIASHYVHTYLLSRPITAEGRPRDTLVMGEGGHVFLFSSSAAFDGKPSERWARRATRPGPVSKDVILAHGASGIMLPLIPRNEGPHNQGSILVMGGSEDPSVEQSAQVYDPYQDKWCPASVPLGIPRFQPSTALLPDGNILIVAGTPFPTVYGENLPQRIPQILDPRTGAVWTGSAWPDPYTRGYHTTVALLPDARVVVAGGRTFEGGDPDVTTYWDERTDLRYYYPPYFGPIAAGKPRITIDATPPSIGYGAPAAVRYSKGPVDMVAVVGLAAQTHCFDMNARHVQLDFVGGSTEAGTVSIKGPPDRATAPPGPYMLFLMHRVDGWLVPSVAKIVFVK